MNEVVRTLERARRLGQWGLFDDLDNHDGSIVSIDLSPNHRADPPPCGACGHKPSVGIVALKYSLPPAYQGHQLGWGCLRCGLPMDGAIAALCIPCALSLSSTHDISSMIKYIMLGAIGCFYPVSIKSLYWLAGQPVQIEHSELYHQPQIPGILIPGIQKVQQVFWSVN